MLKLVVKNSPSKSKYKNHADLYRSCRTNCAFFDITTKECGVFSHEDVDSLNMINRCHLFQSRNGKSTISPAQQKKIANIQIELRPKDLFSFEFQGHSNNWNDLYPKKPNIKSNYLAWYSNGEYGCWVLNTSRPRVFQKRDRLIRGWAQGVYKYPVPLHNHHASKSIRNFMTWFIDQDGYGQYVLLFNHNILVETANKPKGYI